ncbi:unnamed protein product, partial [Meganyctiphanes norvegica]
ASQHTLTSMSRTFKSSISKSKKINKGKTESKRTFQDDGQTRLPRHLEFHDPHFSDKTCLGNRLSAIFWLKTARSINANVSRRYKQELVKEMLNEAKPWAHENKLPLQKMIIDTLFGLKGWPKSLHALKEKYKKTNKNSKCTCVKDVTLSLRELLICSICIETAKDPVMSRCEHYLCEECSKKFIRNEFEKHQRRNPNINFDSFDIKHVPCPICQQPIGKYSIAKAARHILTLLERAEEIRTVIPPDVADL